MRWICLMPRPPNESPSLWAQPPASIYRHCRNYVRGERRGAEIANVRVGQLADPVSHKLDQIENEIGGAHLAHPAIGWFGTDKAAILRQFVDRLAAAADRKIIAALAAQFDAGVDVLAHALQDCSRRHVGQLVAIDVAKDKVAVLSALQSKQFRRKGRDVPRPIHAGDRERLDQLIEKHRLLRAQYHTSCVIDLADKAELARRGRRQAPEFAQKAVIGVFDAGLAARSRETAPLAPLHLEAVPAQPPGN